MRVSALAIAAAFCLTSAAAAETALRSPGVKAPAGDRVSLSTQSAGRQGNEAAPGLGEGRSQFGAAPVFAANAPATPRTRGLAPQRTKLSFRMPWVTGVFQ